MEWLKAICSKYGSSSSMSMCVCVPNFRERREGGRERGKGGRFPRVRRNQLYRKKLAAAENKPKKCAAHKGHLHIVSQFLLLHFR